MEIKISIIDSNNNIVICCDDRNVINDVLEVLKEKSLIRSEERKVYSKRLKVSLDIFETFENNLIQTGDTIYIN